MILIGKRLQHPFFQGDMSKRLALELLQKVSNPSHMFSDLEPDEDGVFMFNVNAECLLMYSKYFSQFLTYHNVLLRV